MNKFTLSDKLYKYSLKFEEYWCHIYLKDQLKPEDMIVMTILNYLRINNIGIMYIRSTGSSGQSQGVFVENNRYIGSLEKISNNIGIITYEKISPKILEYLSNPKNYKCLDLNKSLNSQILSNQKKYNVSDISVHFSLKDVVVGNHKCGCSRHDVEQIELVDCYKGEYFNNNACDTYNASWNRKSEAVIQSMTSKTKHMIRTASLYHVNTEIWSLGFGWN